MKLLDQRLHSRGILKAATRMNWKAGRNGWHYPVHSLNGEISGERWKNQDSSAAPKSLWIKGNASTAPYYAPPNVAPVDGVIYLVEGEPDVLTFLEASRSNIFSPSSGVSTPLPNLARDLAALGVQKVIQICDNDAPGLSFAAHVRDLLAGSGIEHDPRVLSVKDANELWQVLNFDAGEFWRQVDNACLADLPAPEVKPTAREPRQRPDTYDGDDVIQHIKSRLDIVDYIGRDIELKKRGKTYKGKYRQNERTASLTVFPATQSYKDFGDPDNKGDIFNYVMRRDNCDFAEALQTLASEAGIDLPERPKVSISALIITDLSAAPDTQYQGTPETISEFVDFVPPHDWLIERFLQLHQIGDFLDHAAGGLVLLLRHEQVKVEGWTSDQAFTVASLVQFAESSGINTNEKTIRRGLAQLVALGFYRVEKASTNGKGRPTDLYYPCRLSEALKTFNEKLKYRAYERAYGQYTPAPAAPEWFSDDDPATAEKLAAYVNQVSGDVYRDCGDKMSGAEAKYQENLQRPEFQLHPSIWSRPAKLPSGEMKDGRAFRERYYAEQVTRRAETGRNITTTVAAAQIGVNPRTLTVMRDRLCIVTDEQFKEFEIDPEKDVLRQVDNSAKWAAGRNFGRYLESTSGQGISVDPENPAGLRSWVQKQAAAGHTVTGKIQLPSRERFTTPDEVEHKRQERKVRYGNADRTPSKPAIPALPQLREVLEAFPDTFRPDWIKAQLSLRPVDQLVMEAIRMGAEISPLEAKNDLFPFSTPYKEFVSIDRVQKREINNPEPSPERFKRRIAPKMPAAIIRRLAESGKNTR